MRFVFDPSINHFTDTDTGKTYCEYNLEEVVDLLNGLAQENVQLGSDIYQSKIIIRDLKRQHQKLKGRLDDLGVEYY